MSQRSSLRTATIRSFDGGWNVIDDDLNLSSRFAKTFDNVIRHADGSIGVRWGTRLMCKLDDGVVTNLGDWSITLTTTAGSRIVTITKTTHGLLDGDHIEMTALTDGAVNGIPNASFIRKFGIKVTGANTFTITVDVVASSTGTTASRTASIIKDNHTMTGEVVNGTYFGNNLIVGDNIGEIVSITGAGVATRIWSHALAQALVGTPAGWGLLNFISFAAFKGKLVICNGVDKPLLLDPFGTPLIQFLQDLATGSNANTPVGKFVVNAGEYVCIAGDSSFPDRLHISNKGTSGTWYGDLAPNDGAYFDIGKYSPAINQEIKGLARYRDRLAIMFEDHIVLATLGIYSGSTHTPSFKDVIAQHGTICHRSIQSLGYDLLMCDHIGVPTIAQAISSGIITPTRVSQLIDPEIQKLVVPLQINTTDNKMFSVHNGREYQYMLFIPNHDNTVLNLTASAIRSMKANTTYLRVSYANHGLRIGDQVTIANAVAIDGIPASEINKTHIVQAVVDENIFTIKTTTAAVTGYQVSNTNGMTLTILFSESIGMVFTYNRALKIQSWARFRGWKWRFGCVSQYGRLFFGYQNKIFVYGAEDDPIYSDFLGDYNSVWAVSTAYAIGDKVYDTVDKKSYICLVAHTSASSGAFSADRALNPTNWEQYTGEPIKFEWRMPWADFEHRADVKTIRYVGLDTKGYGTFTLELFVDRFLTDNEFDLYQPEVSMQFVGGDAGGYGAGPQPFGGGRRTRTEQLWNVPLRCKLFCARVIGEVKEPLRLVALTVMYKIGNIRT